MSTYNARIVHLSTTQRENEINAIRIEDGTFAAACYEQNTIAELEIINARGFSDQADCSEWNLTAAEWRQQIALALAAKRADA